MIENIANIDAHNGDHTTALHTACHTKQYDIVKTLIDSNANVNVIDITGSTPLIEYCRSSTRSDNDLDIIDLLVNHGANINSRSFKGYHNPMNISQMSALMWASFYGHDDIVQRLIEKGADVNATNSHGHTARELYNGIAKICK